jgi:hypothetical protein
MIFFQSPFKFKVILQNKRYLRNKVINNYPGKLLKENNIFSGINYYEFMFSMKIYYQF